MDYTVVIESSSWASTTVVKELLKAGRTLQGGVGIARDQGSETYVQAMIKEIK